MRINKNNYEAFLLDLSEGNLSDELQNELHSYLAANPDLEVELINDFVTFDHESKITIDKDLLKFDEINISNRRHFFIAYHEGDFNASKQKVVEQFLTANPSLQKEFDEFSKLHLKSTNETYFDKETLHSIADDDRSRGLFYWSLRIAAILLIALILNSLYQNSSKVAPKYALEEGILNFKPSIEQGEKFDVSKYVKTENQKEKTKTFTLAETAQIDEHFSFKKMTTTKKDSSKDRKENVTDINYVEKEVILKRNPDLDEVIANLNPIRQKKEREIVNSLQAKKIKTPPSLFAYLGQKAKEKEILSENGRPNIVSLINKGSKSLTGQDVLAQTQTNEASSTIFQLGGFKIERISKK